MGDLGCIPGSTAAPAQPQPLRAYRDKQAYEVLYSSVCISTKFSIIKKILAQTNGKIYELHALPNYSDTTANVTTGHGSESVQSCIPLVIRKQEACFRRSKVFPGTEICKTFLRSFTERKLSDVMGNVLNNIFTENAEKLTSFYNEVGKFIISTAGTGISFREETTLLGITLGVEGKPLRSGGSVKA